MNKLNTHELNRKSLLDFKKSKKTPIIIILDDVRSLNNIGSIFRTSDAFLIEKVFLCGITATPPHNEIHKTALGATESVLWEYCDNILDLIRVLQDQNISVIAIEQVENATYLQNFDVNKNKKYALIFGNEVFGVSQKVIEICDEIIEIPQLGTKHSLNIAVSAGIVIWNFFKEYNY